MADRTVNININYKVNTVDVQKAADLSLRAQAATDGLRAAATKAGQGIQQGFTQGTRSIESMNIQLARLKTQIQVSSDPKRIAELSNQYKLLAKQIDEANKKAGLTPKVLNDTGKATQGVASQFGQLYTAVKLFLTAGIVKEVFDLTLGMAELKGNVEGVERAFARAFPNELNLLKDLREATHGAVTDFELMQRTLQATNLGVAVEKLPVLFEFAAARAQQTGESVDYLVDSIVRGIGRKSVLVLDNLGLSATRLKEQFNGAAIASQSVGDVTAAVARIAEEELNKMGGFIENDKTRVDQLKVAFEQLRITIAKKLESGGLITFFRDVVQGVEMAIKGQKQLTIETARNLAAQDAARIVESKAFKDLGEDQQKKLDFIQQEINTRVELIGRSNDNITALKEERKEIQNVNPYDKRIDAITRNIKAEDANRFVLASTILVLKDYFKELNKLSTAEPDTSGIVERKKKEIEGIQEAIEKTNKLSDLGLWGKLTQRLEIAQAELGDLQRAFTDKIDPKPFEIKIDNATKSLTNFSAVIERLDESMGELANFKFKTPPPVAVFPPTFWQQVGEVVKDNWREITQVGIDIQADQLKSLAETELNSLKGRLVALKNFYDNQQNLAGDNERAKSELRIREERETTALQKKIFQKEKEVRRTQAIIDGAAGVAKAFATYAWPYSLVVAALVAAQTAEQVAIINRQQPRFAKGVIDLKGPGTGTSDSIDAKLSRGESVMTAKETKGSMGILKAIRAKKLDDQIIKNLHLTKDGVKFQGMNDERIVAELRKQKYPDYMQHAGILFEAKKSQDGLHKQIRRKSMG